MSDAGPLRIAVVCEAAADQRTACRLADRVVCERIDWVEQAHLQGLREWCGADAANSFLAWKRVKRVAVELGVRAHGGFGGEPGAPDAQAGRLALLVLRHLHPDLAAVLLIRDADQQSTRRTGLNQARDYAQRPFVVIIGLAVTKRECWLLAAFQPENEHEQGRLANLRRQLGFDPCDKSAELTAGKQDKRSAKHVVRILCQEDQERAERGIDATPLDVLKERGCDNGLAEYLAELEERLVPLFHRSPRTSRRTP